MPTTAATKAFALLAKRGAGKSYTGAVMAEEFAKAGVPFVVFDPIDVWWGLRLAADGKGKGLPVVVFGLQHADIQLERGMGKKIARAVVEENISCVISTFGMPKTAMREIVADFAEELLNINNTPRHIFIEEAHEFVPQRVSGAMGRCFAAVEALLVMGRNRGIGVTLINQRAATINKDLLTQVDTLVALRSVGPQDRKALKEWVEFHSAEGDLDKFLNSLPSLPTGEAWVWSPEFLEVFERVKIRKRETFHPDREKLGMTFKMPEIKQGDIQTFIEKFSKPKSVPIATTKLGSSKNIPSIKSSGDGYDIHFTDTQKLIDKAVALEHSICLREIEKERASWRKLIEHLRKHILKAHEFLSTPARLEPDLYFAFEDQKKNGRLVAGNAKSEVPVISSRNNGIHHDKVIFDDLGGNAGDTGDNKLGLCERKIYTFLFTNPDRSFSKVQIAAITGYSFSSGGFKNSLSRLSTLALIKRDGENFAVNVLDESLALKGGEYNYDVSLWVSRLDKCPREIFKFLLDHPEQIYSKVIVADMLGYSVSSGGFKNSVSKLSSLGLLTRHGQDIAINKDILDL